MQSDQRKCLPCENRVVLLRTRQGQQADLFPLVLDRFYEIDPGLQPATHTKMMNSIFTHEW